MRHGRYTFHITFESTATKPSRSENRTLPSPHKTYNDSHPRAAKSSIRVSMLGCRKQGATVATVASFLKDVARDYLAYTDSLRKSTQSRYDYAASGKWVWICSLYEVQGLQTVALSLQNEQLIQKDLETFVRNKGFYKRIGAPYVRGYLLYGKPGTGKTSLVFAIAYALIVPLLLRKK